jgi:hypothetical protein
MFAQDQDYQVVDDDEEGHVNVRGNEELGKSRNAVSLDDSIVNVKVIVDDL